MSKTLYTDIRAAFTARLKALQGRPEVAWENRKFKPGIDVPYLIPALLMAEPSQVTIGEDGLNEEGGIYQITLTNYPADTGVGEMTDMASLIRDWFKRGTELTYNGLLIKAKKVSISPITSSNEIHVSVAFYLQTMN